MNETQKDLVRVSARNGYRTWEKITEYAYNYTKYDNLTFRQLDKVFESVKNTV